LRKKIKNHKAAKKDGPRLQDYIRQYKGSNGKILVKRSKSLKVICMNQIVKSRFGLISLLNKEGNSLASVLEDMPTKCPMTIGVFKCL
jgi:hypothetical protein